MEYYLGSVAAGVHVHFYDEAIQLEVGDVLVMVLCHKGSDWAILPDGWTLICRDVSGVVRGEAYWRRCEDISATYNVTGMTGSTYAAVGLMAFGGCLKSGNPIADSAVRANASGATGTAGITTAVDNSLVFNVDAVSKYVYTTYPQECANLPEMVYVENLYYPWTMNLSLGIAYQMMPDHGDTGATTCAISGGADNVGMCFALIPDPDEPSLTYDEEMTGACTNITEGTAKIIPSSPYTLVESMEDGVQDLWFSYTPSVIENTVIYPWLSPCYGQYMPAIDIFYYVGAVKTYLFSGYPLNNLTQVTTFLLAAGETYYFHLMNVSGFETDQTGLEFILQLKNIDVVSDNTPHAGDLFIPDDTAGLPTSLIDRQGQKVRGYLDYPAGENTDTLQNGYSLTDDYADHSVLRLYDPSFNLVKTIEFGSNFRWLVIYGGYSDYFWVAYRIGAGVNLTLTTITITGDFGPKSWTLPNSTSAGALSIDPAETTAYYALISVNQPVQRYDLVNEVALTNLAAGVPGYYMPGNDKSMVMADGSIVIPYTWGSAPRSFLRRYAPDGTILNTYEFDGYTIDRICLDNDDDSFWVWCYSTELTFDRNYYFHVKASDGTIDNQFFTNNQQAGTWIVTGDLHVLIDPATYMLTSESCSFFVVRVGIKPSGTFWPILLLLADDLPPCAPEKRPSTKCVTPGL